MKKTILTIGLFALALSGKAQTIYTDSVSAHPYVQVIPYINHRTDTDSVTSMWIIATHDAYGDGSCTYELRSATGSVIEQGYFSINGDNYTIWESANQNDKKTFQLLSTYLKNQPK